MSDEEWTIDEKLLAVDLNRTAHPDYPDYPDGDDEVHEEWLRNRVKFLKQARNLIWLGYGKLDGKEYGLAGHDLQA